MARSTYAKYKYAIEKMGFKQVDVYRYKDKEIVRIQRISDGRVYLIELPRKRGEIGVDEYIKLLKETLSKTR